MKDKDTYWLYRVIRWLVWLFSPKFKIVGAENLPDEPCVIVGNHSQIYGPITGERYTSVKHDTWCAGEMMDRKGVPASSIPRTSHWRTTPMKKQRVDYSGFSLRRLNEPRFSHVKLLAGWIAYFALYFLTENLIPLEKCHVIHGFLDDVIPFREGFVIFYVGWYLLVFGALAYTFFYDVESFKKMQVYIMITQALAMLCYILYPSVQDLRPAVFPRQNVFTWLLGIIYAFDTPSGVCPSLHVAYSIGILSVGLKDKELPAWFRAALTVFVVMVCLAVCFVKQHSSLDVLAALPVCMIAELAVYGKDYWKPRCRFVLRKTKKRIA